MITYVKGDLFAANERALCHGCNCHGVMGAGVAAIVRDRFPHAYQVYKAECERRLFYPGVAQPVNCYKEINDDGSKVYHGIGEQTTVYNLATQNAPGANARLDYVKQAFRNMKNHMEYVGNLRIAMPKIGSGIGGLNWEDVEQSILYTLDGLDIVVYEL